MTSNKAGAASYGLYLSEIEGALSLCGSGASVRTLIDSLLYAESGEPHALAMALLILDGTEGFAQELALRANVTVDEIDADLKGRIAEAAERDFQLSGAEAVALILRESGALKAFAYAGTSELALCDAFARVTDVELINGRGDKESAFMAAGAGLLAANRGTAVLHGARGLTNATGAIADVRRNEAGVVFVVGLPSTASARFLPPHAEPDLMQSIGNFVKSWHEASPVPEEGSLRFDAATDFVAALWKMVNIAEQKPHGPTLFGLPQDVAETAWIPWSVFSTADHSWKAEAATDKEIQNAAAVIDSASRALVLIDDHLLHYEGAKAALADFASRANAPVLQVRYKRGPMLFERLAQQDVPSFLGWLDPSSDYHQKLLSETDLLITIEDRNMYQRVVGDLPMCQKLVLNSDVTKVSKNEYLGKDDIVIGGDPVAAMQRLSQLIAPGHVDSVADTWADELSGHRESTTVELVPEVALVRTGIVRTISSALSDFDTPVLVDDSQMFGGLISEHYDLLSPKLRVFGDHGAFVGGGISYATGLALANPSAVVVCTVGDQGFTNNLQGLVASGQQRAKIVYLVCNNGQSVSLLKQSSTQRRWFDDGRQPYLHNPQGLNYAALATQLGIASSVVEFGIDRGINDIETDISTFAKHLDDALKHDGPSLIEMRLPSLGEFWAGIWVVNGFEETRATV